MIGNCVRYFWSPYFQLAMSAILISAAELFLKTGAVSAASQEQSAWLAVAPLASTWTWLGIVLYIISFISWLYVLKLLPLNQAFALINVVHILVPVAAAIFLGETISIARWGGIALVLIGTTLVAAPAAKAEEGL